MASEVLLDRDGGVGVLRLCAPDRRNALTVEMAERVVEICNEIDNDPGIGAVVVYGEGGYFCAGGDRPTLARAGEDPAEPERFEGLGMVYRAFTRVGELEPPTIAAVEGGAVGAGMNMLLATDLRVVAAEAKLISGFLPIGLHPGGGHTGLLTRAAGREAAAAMALFGARITGKEAAEIGLAWAATDTGETLDVAIELARTPAADPELARRTARSMRSIAGPPAIPWNVALETERSAQMWSMRRAAEKRTEGQG